MAKSALGKVACTALAGGLSLALAVGMVGCGGSGSSAAKDPSTLSKGEYDLNDDSIEPSTWEEAGSPNIEVTGSGVTVMDDGMIDIAFTVKSEAKGWVAESLPVTISVQGENGLGDAAVILGTVYPGQTYAYSLNMEQLQFTKGAKLSQYAMTADDEAESNDTNLSGLLTPAYADEAEADGDVPEGTGEVVPISDAIEVPAEGDEGGAAEETTSEVLTISDGPTMGTASDLGTISDIEVRTQPISANWRKTDLTDADVEAAYKAGDAKVEQDGNSATLTAPISMDTRYIDILRNPSSEGISMAATVIAIFKDNSGNVIYGSSTQVAILMDSDLEDKENLTKDDVAEGQGYFDGDVYKVNTTMTISDIPSDRKYASYEIYVNPGL